MTTATTSTPVKVGIESFSASSMTRRRVFLAYFTETKYESMRMLRMPAFSIPFLALPVLLYLLFAVVLFGDVGRRDLNTASFLFTAFAVFGVIGPAMFGFGVTVAIERDQGLLRFKRALPMPPAAYLLAKMLMAVLFATIVIVSLIVSAVTLGHLSLSGRQTVVVMLVNILGVLPFCAVSTLARLCPAEARRGLFISSTSQCFIYRACSSPCRAFCVPPRQFGRLSIWINWRCAPLDCRAVGPLFSIWLFLPG